tara:strand:- start:74 stop:373 length:300 start_codon:yes stop_codon:yes gene_type:complete
VRAAILNTPPRFAAKSIVGIATGFNTVGSGIAVGVASDVEARVGKIAGPSSDELHAKTTELITIRSRKFFATKRISPLNLSVEWVASLRLSVPQAVNIE